MTDKWQETMKPIRRHGKRRVAAWALLMLCALIPAGCTEKRSDPADATGQGLYIMVQNVREQERQDAYGLWRMQDWTQGRLNPTFNATGEVGEIADDIEEIPWHTEAHEIIRKEGNHVYAQMNWETLHFDTTAYPGLLRRFSEENKFIADCRLMEIEVLESMRSNPDLWDVPSKLTNRSSFTVLRADNRLVCAVNAEHGSGMFNDQEVLMGFCYSPETGADVTLNGVVNDLDKLTELTVEAFRNAYKHDTFATAFFESDDFPIWLKQQYAALLVEFGENYMLAWAPCYDGFHVYISLRLYTKDNVPLNTEYEGGRLGVVIDYESAPDLFNAYYTARPAE